MQLLNNIYAGYRASAKGLVRGNEVAPALVAIKDHLPAFFHDQILATGRDDANYRCYGGFGEVNRNFAHIPWVACCRRNIARKVQDGYFVVLLFRQDMAGCWLSLNQGFTQYKEAFVDDQLARQQSRAGAQTLVRMIVPPEGFVIGPIDLGATSSLGRGYEAGAVISRYYAAGDPEIEQPRVEDDFRRLLALYDDLAARAGNRVIALLPDEDEPYQAAAAEIARKPAKIPQLPQGPLPPPERQAGNARGGWRRDPGVAAAALHAADSRCEWNRDHETFIARRSRRNFVEAHHLIPVRMQANYPHRLDVAENVVSLCPTCHRKVHHGLGRERTEMAVAFFRRRQLLLAARGIHATEQDVRAIYRHELDDE
ncbi:DUF3578 domain-containing protein [Rhizobium laguerreae]|uniref:MrcB family domain-containing protein n=1 Tax=Rhizobium laguerreae TaxID=1076926 RepID=UPI001C915DB9|nr:DUF3578 domain-containing protein [Rhizobium laguerreae]MBY3474088.1 DUF3578 domain-containing protein [Rhizobium laguerreae]MBY3521882.1 DUF3578 domain-containing protein [Rhizobium laguerreae]